MGLVGSAAGCTALAVVTLVGSGAAQAAVPGQIEEIVVTARKTAERLQDVPLTVTAFTGAQLESAGIKSLNDLQGFTPGLNAWTEVDRGYGQILFRGMDNSAPTGDTTRELASMFIDGVYYVGTVSLVNFEDMERVEVVKGPQSAFFGRSTFSGAINFVTKDPGDHFAVHMKGTIASDDDYEFSGSTDGPLVADRLGGRVSVGYRTFGGQYTNFVDGQRLGAEEDKNVAATLVATPSDALRVRARVMYQNTNDGPAASQLLGQIPQHNCGPFGGINRGGNATLYCGVLTFDPAKVGLTDHAVGQAAQLFGNDYGLKRDFLFATLNADWQMAAGWTISSLTGYTREKQRTLYDFARTPADVWGAYARRYEKAFSEEVRLTTPQDARLRGVLGLYYLWQRNQTSGNFFTGTQNPFDFVPGFGAGFVFPTTPTISRITNEAVFGSVSYEIATGLTASVEGRYQRDNVTSILPTQAVEAITKTFLPRFIIDYKPVPSVTLYVNVARGDKPTQANAATAALSADRQAIVASVFNVFPTAPEEKIWNYEFGAKTTFLDGRGLLNVAAFYADWRNKQGVKGVQYDFNGNGVVDLQLTGANAENLNAQVYSAGNLHVYGLEAETQLALTRTWTVGGTLAVANPKIVKLEDSTYFAFFGTLNAAGKQEPRVARLTGSITSTLRDHLTAQLDWFVRADGIYTGSKWADILNTAKTGDSFKVNLRLGVAAPRYTVTLFVDNLFNNKTLQSLAGQADSAIDPFLFLPHAYEAVLPRLRQVGVTATLDF